MSWNWPLAVVIVAVLLFAYCAYSTHEATRSVDRALNDDSWTQQRCYAAGYDAGFSDRPPPPADEADECDRWFSIGFSDGRSAYETYEDLLD